MTSPVWWTYGASLWSDGRLYVDPAEMLPAFGYEWPPADRAKVAATVAEILASVGVPAFKDCWLIAPSRN